MWINGKSQFRMALEELAERYGVDEQLSVSVNKPDIEKRTARPEELGAFFLLISSTLCQIDFNVLSINTNGH